MENDGEDRLEADGAIIRHSTWQIMRAETVQIVKKQWF